MRPGQTKAVPVEAEPLHRTVFQNDEVRVYYVRIPAGRETLLHHHAHPYVTIGIGEAEFANEVEGEAPRTLRLRDGEALEAAGGYAHVIRNLGERPFVNLTMEFLKKPARAGGER